MLLKLNLTKKLAWEKSKKSGFVRIVVAPYLPLKQTIISDLQSVKFVGSHMHCPKEEPSFFKGINEEEIYRTYDDINDLYLEILKFLRIWNLVLLLVKGKNLLDK